MIWFLPAKEQPSTRILGITYFDILPKGFHKFLNKTVHRNKGISHHFARGGGRGVEKENIKILWRRNMGKKFIK